MPDDTTTTDDDQRIPQSDQSCECGRPLPCVSAFPVHGGTQYISCPCGIEYATKWPNVRGKVPSTPAELTPGEWTPTNAGRDPYPPHDAPWLDECDCDECAEPTHLEEAHMRATDHYSDTEDDMTDDSDADDTAIDDPEAYLEERYGVVPDADYLQHQTQFRLHVGATISMAFTYVGDDSRRAPGWTWEVNGERYADEPHDTLPAACRAADDAARDLLAETAERLEGCDGTEEDGGFTASGAFDPEQPLENDGTVFDLLNMVSEDGYHPTFADALADVGDEDGSPFTATVTDLGERTMISIDADADEKSTQELANELVQQRKRKAALKAKYNGEPETNDQPDPTAICSDHLAYLSRRYHDAYPVPPADRFEALDVAYEVPAGLGAVRFAESDGLLMWRRVAVDETPGYCGDPDWTAVEGLAPVCRDAEEKVCALEPEGGQ